MFNIANIKKNDNIAFLGMYSSGAFLSHMYYLFNNLNYPIILFQAFPIIDFQPFYINQILRL